MYTQELHHAWYTTRIEDRNGNSLTITYDTLANSQYAIIKSITSSDGRTVNFTYTDTTDFSKIRLTSVTANGQTWNYQYTAVVGATGYYQLTRVLRPDGLAWNYSYYSGRTGSVAGNWALQRVTYPYGATTTYDYAYACFNAQTCSSSFQTYFSLVVKSKVNGGRDVVAGTWTYTYAPSSIQDTTTVNFPGGRHVYKHFGMQIILATGVGTGKLWSTGLLKEKQTYNGATLVNQEIYTWGKLTRSRTNNMSVLRSMAAFPVISVLPTPRCSRRCCWKRRLSATGPLIRPRTATST